MPPPPYTPQDKRYMREYIDSIGGVKTFASRHRIALRTAERIYAGTFAPSASLLAECSRAGHIPTHLLIDENDVPY